VTKAGAKVEREPRAKVDFGEECPSGRREDLGHEAETTSCKLTVAERVSGAVLVSFGARHDGIVAAGSVFAVRAALKVMLSVLAAEFPILACLCCFKRGKTLCYTLSALISRPIILGRP
jgi:hypothetical protein